MKTNISIIKPFEGKTCKAKFCHNLYLKEKFYMKRCPSCRKKSLIIFFPGFNRRLGRSLTVIPPSTLSLRSAISKTSKLSNSGVSVAASGTAKLAAIAAKTAFVTVIAGVTTPVVGLAYAQTQTELDIIPDITFFQDGNLISFSQEEVQNLFSEYLDPDQYTILKNFLEESTVEEISSVETEAVSVETEAVVEEISSVETEAVSVETEAVSVETEAVSVETEAVVEFAEENNCSAEIKLTGLYNALCQIEKNITKFTQRNHDRLQTGKNINSIKDSNGLTNAREHVKANIVKTEEKINDKPEPKENKPEPKENKPEPKENKPEPKENKPEPKENKPEPKENKPEPKENTPEPKKEGKGGK